MRKKIFGRFVFVGLINTGFTYVLYLLLIRIFPYIFAYSLTYLFGIALGYVLNAKIVFEKRINFRSALSYPFGYFANYLLCLVLLWVFVSKMKIPQKVAPLLVLCVSTPFMFLIANVIFRGGGKNRIESDVP